MKFAKLLRTPILKNIYKGLFCIRYDLHKYICKPCLENLPKDLNKTYQLFARIPYIIAILKNQSNDDLSDSNENAHRRVPHP